MSVADNFLHLGPFPFCVPNVALGGTYDSLAGLTLTNVMELFWNLEDVEITTAGTSNTANAAGVLSFDGPTRTGAWVNNTEWDYPVDGGMLRLQVTPVAFGSLPATTKDPNERVCSEQYIFNWGCVDDGTANISLIHSARCEMALNIDPSDSSKYAVFYRFLIRAGSFGGDTVTFCNPSRGSQSNSGLYTTGTFNIAGHSFGWRCYYNNSLTGGDMSASTTLYTY